jgi:hypothetical protein
MPSLRHIYLFLSQLAEAEQKEKVEEEEEEGDEEEEEEEEEEKEDAGKPKSGQGRGKHIRNVRIIFLSWIERVTKRCRLSWQTDSALVYEPKCGGGVVGVSANECSCVHMELK